MCRPVTLGVFQYDYPLITVPCGTLLVQKHAFLMNLSQHYKTFYRILFITFLLGNQNNTLQLVSPWYKRLLISPDSFWILCILNNIVKFGTFFLYIKNSKCYLIYLTIEIPVCLIRHRRLSIHWLIVAG